MSGKIIGFEKDLKLDPLLANLEEDQNQYVSIELEKGDTIIQVKRKRLLLSK